MSLAGLLLVESPANSGEHQNDRRRAVEAALLKVAGPQGHSASSMDEHLRFHLVPGASVAVLSEGIVDWAAGYGVRSAADRAVVTPDTLFQAASVSKPLTALAAMRLIDRGVVSLDGDVNQWLRTWQVPSTSEITAPIALRHLLSHTAGLSVGGFAGYSSTTTVPSTVDVLSGRGNSPAVTRVLQPGAEFRYSGGGYTVVQLLIEEVTGLDFALAMNDLVLSPLGMESSTFAQPLPSHLGSRAAIGHDAKGAPIAGGWHAYPEQAAAGLWTTPTDLAKFVVGTRNAYRGTAPSLLRQDTAIRMLTRERDDYGLGPGLAGTGERQAFAHPGGNAGFRAFFFCYLETGNGVIVMSNGDGGGAFNMEFVRAVAGVYDWPDFR